MNIEIIDDDYGYYSNDLLIVLKNRSRITPLGIIELKTKEKLDVTPKKSNEEIKDDKVLKEIF